VKPSVAMSVRIIREEHSGNLVFEKYIIFQNPANFMNII
jgi:hypothetical protein